jgi:gliding motility-associated-like protein
MLRFLSVVSISIIMLITVSSAASKPGISADPLSPSDFIVTGSSCTANGSVIFNKANTTGYVLSWVDTDGKPHGSKGSMKGIYAGRYTLTYTINGTETYTMELDVPQTYPYAITQNDLLIPCDQTSIRVQGESSTNTSISTYLWEDASGRKVGDDEYVYLTAGQYYLTVTDRNGCASNRASILVKASAPRPLIDPNALVVTTAGCGAPDGSISGLKIVSPETGPFTYVWNNSLGEQVGDQLNLTSVPAGRYRLTVRLPVGLCESISNEIEIKPRNPISTSTNSFASKSADCNLPNGSITGVKTDASAFKWIDTEGNTVATTLDMVDVKEGYYELILSNNFGCQERIGPFHIKAGDPPIAMQSVPLVENDSCSLGIGSITGASVIGSNIRYSWTDATGIERSRNPDLRNVKAGEYILTIRNPSCSQSFSYTVGNVESPLAAPMQTDKFVCAATDILITFAETAPLYRIYDQNIKLLKESKSKSFMLNVNGNMELSAAVARGSCESLRTVFKISVGEASLKIPNSFSPNNDGINDSWVINGIEIYNTADIKIFNRYGLLVYQSSNPKNTFNGKKDGTDLPAGVYYYIIALTNECKPFTGSLTLLR